MTILQKGRFFLASAIFCFFSTILLANPANPDQLSFIIGTESAKMGEEMCVEVMTCNFDLIGFQFTISWDEDIVGFSRVEKPNIPFFLQSSYQEFDGMFRVAWINENITAPVALPDSSAVFTLCFTPKRPGRSALIFDRGTQTPLHPEFIGLNGAEDAVLVSGAITVLGCSATTTQVSQQICNGASFEGYTQSGQYTDTFQDGEGCDSTRILNLSIATTIESTIELRICEGENYGGRVQAGTYTDTFQSVVSGCDSIRTLHLSVSPNIQQQVDQTICAGSCITIGGIDYCSSGVYTNTLTTSSGCDSLITYNVSVADQITGFSSVQICSGDVWIEGGNSIREEGTSIFNYISSTGCDSLHTVQVSFYPQAISTSEEVSICEGANFGGRTQAGVYTDSFTNINGCDSTHTIVLSIASNFEELTAMSICAGESFNGYTESGQYRNTFVTASGCDSVSILNLTVQPAFENTITQNICEGEVVEGYTSTGQFRDVFVAENGCDSIRVLNLTVASSIETIIETAICEGENFEGFTTSGTYTNLFTANSGCDSIRTLRLSVDSKIETIIDVTICEGEAYEGFDRTGNFLNLFQSVSGCDSIRELRLRVNPRSETVITTAICEGEDFEGFTNAGSYTNNFIGQNGCDSIRVLNLSILSTEDTACNNSTTPTINISALVSLNYYPNPVASNLYLDWNGESDATYSIMDLTGRTLLPNTPLESSTIANIQHFNTGVYYLKINLEGKAYYAKLIKL